MEFKSHQTLIFISFTLIFFNSAHAKCVPRNGSTSSPSPNVKPISSPKTPPSSSPPSSPPPSSSPPSSPAPSSSDKTPSPTQSQGDGKQFKRPILNALSAAIPQPGGDNPVIKKICDGTDYPDVCIATLGHFKGPGDIPNVLGAAIKAGLDLAKTALEEAEKLANQPGTPQDKAGLYKECKDSYDDAEYNFQKAVDALPGKDIGTMNTMLSAAITDVGDCEDAFQGKDCPLATFSDKLTKMASNCLAIISMIH